MLRTTAQPEHTAAARGAAGEFRGEAPLPGACSCPRHSPPRPPRGALRARPSSPRGPVSGRGSRPHPTAVDPSGSLRPGAGLVPQGMARRWGRAVLHSLGSFQNLLPPAWTHAESDPTTTQLLPPVHPLPSPQPLLPRLPTAPQRCCRFSVPTPPHRPPPSASTPPRSHLPAGGHLPVHSLSGRLAPHTRRPADQPSTRRGSRRCPQHTQLRTPSACGVHTVPYVATLSSCGLSCPGGCFSWAPSSPRPPAPVSTWQPRA